MIEIELNPDNSVEKTVVNGTNLLHDIRMFYANGGEIATSFRGSFGRKKAP